jgi:hypothetical protein
VAVLTRDGRLDRLLPVLTMLVASGTLFLDDGMELMVGVVDGFEAALGG